LGDRHRWEDNIKTDLKEIGCGGVEWIQLAEDIVVTCSYDHGNELWILQKAKNILTSWETVSQEGLCCTGLVSFKAVTDTFSLVISKEAASSE